MQIRSAHFNPGSINVAFVFSAPGTKEKKQQCPLSGVTGDNLDHALTHLFQVAPDIFSAKTRNAYRITNAYPEPLSVALKSKRSEAPSTKILDPINVQRVLSELQGCHLVVLCGNKAGLLRSAIEHAGFWVVSESHTSNQALVSKHNDFVASKSEIPSERRRLRAEAWAASLIQKIAAKRDL